MKIPKSGKDGRCGRIVYEIAADVVEQLQKLATGDKAAKERGEALLDSMWDSHARCFCTALTQDKAPDQSMNQTIAYLIIAAYFHEHGDWDAMAKRLKETGAAYGQATVDGTMAEKLREVVSGLDSAQASN